MKRLAIPGGALATILMLLILLTQRANEQLPATPQPSTAVSADARSLLAVEECYPYRLERVGQDYHLFAWVKRHHPQKRPFLPRPPTKRPHPPASPPRHQRPHPAHQLNPTQVRQRVHRRHTTTAYGTAYGIVSWAATTPTNTMPILTRWIICLERPFTAGWVAKYLIPGKHFPGH